MTILVGAQRVKKSRHFKRRRSEPARPRLVRPGKGQAGGARAQGGDDVGLRGGLGLDVVGQPVSVVAWEDLATGHGLLRRLGPHLLDVVLVVGVDDGRDVEVGQAVPAREVDLTQHARVVRLAILDGVEVADPRLGELDGRVLLVVDDDGGDIGRSRVAGEVDGALDVVEGPEGDSAGADGGRGGDEGHGRGSEMHLDGVLWWYFDRDWIKGRCCEYSRGLSSEIWTRDCMYGFLQGVKEATS